MSGIGGVGGAGAGGGGAGGGAAAGVAGSNAVTPVSGAPDSGDFSGGNGIKGVGEDGGSSGGGAHVAPTGQNGGMSTQDFTSLKSCHSTGQVNESESGQLDLKKLIEMMMAIKLLQEMSKSQ